MSRHQSTSSHFLIAIVVASQGSLVNSKNRLISRASQVIQNFCSFDHGIVEIERGQAWLEKRTVSPLKTISRNSRDG